MQKKTTDIYFAAALMALGATLSETDKDDPRHMRFCLSLPEDANPKEIESEWANGTLMVNATIYRDSIQRLKSVIHSD